MLVLGTKDAVVMEGRWREALAAYREGCAPVIVLCGANGEAEDMYRALARSGVPEAAMVLEGGSTDTRENLRHARQLLEARGGGAPVGDVLLVTSDYHGRRALHLARHEGLRAAGRWARVPRGWRKAYHVLRELLGWGKHGMGWA